MVYFGLISVRLPDIDLLPSYRGYAAAPDSYMSTKTALVSDSDRRNAEMANSTRSLR